MALMDRPGISLRRSLSPRGGPYAPKVATLGGIPEVIPDVPVTSVFLVLYIIFSFIHFKIMRANQIRGRLFAFSGAMFGFCKLRIITMSLRIAWACLNTNNSLGLAAQIFTYVGTIIPLFINWYFVQRVVRAQHPTWGWSQPFRLFFRAALVCLVLCLLMLIVAFLQQSFSTSGNIHRIDRALQLTGQTYLATFSFAPLVIIIVSLAISRRRVDKFGAGRLRNNIAVLAIATFVISVGTIFRCIVNWLPPRPLRDAQGNLQAGPWYFQDWCFYVFTFATEMIVVIFYAITRFDLRFHIPNGSKGPGDYSAGRDKENHISIIGNEKNLKRASTFHMNAMVHENQSMETLHEFSASIFEDTHTLADSLRYPSSTLEVDNTTGHYKIRRTSGAPSVHSPASGTSPPSLWSPDRDNGLAESAPTLPSKDWPLREPQSPRDSLSVMAHANRGTKSAVELAHRTNEFPNANKAHARTGTRTKLDVNSPLRNMSLQPIPNNDQPPNYETISPVSSTGKRTSRNVLKKKNRRGSEAETKHGYHSSVSSIESDVPLVTSPLSTVPHPPTFRNSVPDLSQKQVRYYSPTNAPSTDLPKKIDPSKTLRRVTEADSQQTVEPISKYPQPMSADLPPKKYPTLAAQGSGESANIAAQDSGKTSFDTADEAFRRFSFEAPSSTDDVLDVPQRPTNMKRKGKNKEGA